MEIKAGNVSGSDGSADTKTHRVEDEPGMSRKGQKAQGYIRESREETQGK